MALKILEHEENRDLAIGSIKILIESSSQESSEILRNICLYIKQHPEDILYHKWHAHVWDVTYRDSLGLISDWCEQNCDDC